MQLNMPVTIFHQIQENTYISANHTVIIKTEVKSKFYKKRGATFFYDVTRKLGPLDFTQYRSKSSSF